MTIRSAHGSGARGAIARVEVLPADELPSAPPDASGAARSAREAGRGLARGDANAARELQRRSAAARQRNREKLRALEALGLDADACPAELVPHLAKAEEFAEAEIRRLAAHVGAGHCPPNVAALVHAAARAMAGAAIAFQRGDVALSARLGQEVRQNLLGAHELCAREAKARGTAALDPDLAAFFA